MTSCHYTRNRTLKLVAVLYNLSGDLVSEKVFSSYWHCTAPEMTLTRKWSPTLKWSPNGPRNDTDPKTISISLHVDPEMAPQLIIGMEWYSAMKLLQVCCSVYVPESHLTFHHGLCYFLALLSLIYSPLCLLFSYLKHNIFKIHYPRHAVLT